MKKHVLILHGWGLQGSRYNDLVAQFPSSYIVDTLDFPGFGNEPLPREDMNLSDYVEFVRNFLRAKRIKSVIIIGHSFGGRVGTKLAYQYPDTVEKLILTGTPIIRHIGFKQKVARIIAPIGKGFIETLPARIGELSRKALYKFIGEYDYLKAGKLKKLLTNVVNEDLTAYAHAITCPVLLVWGEEDTFTPASDVAAIQKIMPHAQGVIVPGTAHRLPYYNPELFVKAIESFI